MASNTFSRIDGWPVAIGIVPDVLRMKRWFKQATGYNLLVSSGIRTYSEQEAIFRQRYTRTPNGRRVYDVRWWQGVPWYRISAAGTVAAPGSSNHETGRSLDLRDDGPDPGVAASFNTHRNRLLSANLHRFGFTHTGKNFREPWHVEQLAIRDPFLGRGKPHHISPDDPGVPLGGGQPTATDKKKEEDEMPKHENKAFGTVQKLDPSQAYPIQLSKGQHYFAIAGKGVREIGELVVDFVFEGGPSSGTAAQVRAVYEQKQPNGTWKRVKTRKMMEIPATGGTSRGQYVEYYSIANDMRGFIEVASQYRGINLQAVEYRKNYWR